jgi:hypothetical protein
MSSALLQIWICASPVLATLLLAPMLVCAKPGVWLPAPVAAIVRAATPAQIAQFGSSRLETSASAPQITGDLPRAATTAIRRSCTSRAACLIAITLRQSAPRAP